MKGFTLIEVMVALVVVAVLAALAYPTYAGYVRKSRRIEGQVALVEAMQQEERYYAQHNAYQPFSATADPASGAPRWWSGSTAATSAYEVDGYACPGHAIDECVELRARPGTARVDASFHDPECETLTLDNSGEQKSTGTVAKCWP
jgi:type IV pilus assembly protein PilE